MTPTTKRAVSLSALVAGVVGVLTWVSHRGADPVYDDDTALAGWADRLAHPPALVEAPADITLPEMATGRPLRQGDPLPVDRSLNVKGPKSLRDAADDFVLGATTSDLLLTVSTRMVRFEGRDVLTVPADPSRGFAEYKHSEDDVELLSGAVAPIVYGRQRAETVRRAADRSYWNEGLLVMADRNVPSRLLVELFATAAAHQFIPYLVGKQAGRVVDVGFSHPNRFDGVVSVALLPQVFELRLPRERGVVVDCERGRSVKGADGAAFISIARRDDGYDFEALMDCARRIERAFSRKLVYGLEPAPVVSVQSLVSAVDALRKDRASDVEVMLTIYPRVLRGPAP